MFYLETGQYASKMQYLHDMSTHHYCIVSGIFGPSSGPMHNARTACWGIPPHWSAIQGTAQERISAYCVVPTPLRLWGQCTSCEQIEVFGHNTAKRWTRVCSGRTGCGQTVNEGDSDPSIQRRTGTIKEFTRTMRFSVLLVHFRCTPNETVAQGQTVAQEQISRHGRKAGQIST